jgi:nucleoside-diphosphate-sugar epimerase
MVNRTGRRPESLLGGLTADEDGRLEFVSADATVASEVLAASDGATHLYHCANPLYHQWNTVLPPMQENLVQAALTTGAVLATAENLYTYARDVMPITESTPEDPPTRKGRIRQRLHEMLRDAETKRGLRFVTVRASDYYGPGAADQSVFGTSRFLDPIHAGKRPLVLGDPDQPHTYTYVGDYGRALAMAAQRTEAYGQVWIVPNDRTLTTRDVARIFFTQTGLAGEVRRAPKVALRLVGLLDPIVREVIEMLYQKEAPYYVDGSRFQTAFGLVPTPLEQGVRETLAWYRTRTNARGVVA